LSRPRFFVSVVTALTAVFLVISGGWALAGPATFFTDVAPFMPYNPHFLHDIGSFQLGLGTILLGGLIYRRALPVALAGNVVAAALHAFSHFMDRSLGGHPATDIPALSALAVVLTAALVIEVRTQDPTAAN
jgi:hypothetical protein